MRAVFVGALITAALLGPATFWRGGVIDREATIFVRQYVEPRPFLQTVFDVRAHDFGTYQVRELSFVFDFLDASFYQFVAHRTARAFFIPLSALLVSLAFVVVFLTGMRRTMPHVDFGTGALLLLCFLTSFGFVSTMGVLYRSGKPVLSVVILAWLFQVHAAARRRNGNAASDRRGPAEAGHHKDRSGEREAGITFALAVAAGLLDRQGFFYVLAACVMLFVHVRSTGELRHILKATVAAALVLVMYTFALGPLLIHSLNGYWPDFSYQRLPVSELLRPYVHLSRAAMLLGMNVGMLLGGLTGVAVVMVPSAALIARSRFDASFGREVVRYLVDDRRGRVAVYAVLALALQLVMFALMIVKHPPVFTAADHWYWYYPMPFLATVLYGLLLMVNGALARMTERQRRYVPLILLLVAVNNGLSLGTYRESMIHGPYFSFVYAQSELLKTSIARGVADPALETGYRVFFDYDRSVRPAVEPQR